MRGIRVTKESRKIDVVLVAARYTAKGDRVKVAKGYVRRGAIWGDLKLLKEMGAKNSSQMAWMGWAMSLDCLYIRRISGCLWLA
jgi:hypothetical protein